MVIVKLSPRFTLAGLGFGIFLSADPQIRILPTAL